MHARLHFGRAETRPAVPRFWVWWRPVNGMGANGLRVRAACALSTLVIAGCGGDDAEYANEPRPPAPINVTAAITERGLSVSPERFGAGPINLIVSNQTARAHSVTFETDEIGGSGPGVRQTTSPINPAATATLNLDVREGSYRLSTDARGAAPSRIEVGARRRSAQDDLLQP